MAIVDIKLDHILSHPSNNLIELANLAGGDVKSFYEGSDLNGIDIKGQNLIGVSFKNCNFDGLLYDKHTQINCPALCMHIFFRNLDIGTKEYEITIGLIEGVFENTSISDLNLAGLGVLFLFLSDFEPLYGDKEMEVEYLYSRYGLSCYIPVLEDDDNTKYFQEIVSLLTKFLMNHGTIIEDCYKKFETIISIPNLPGSRSVKPRVFMEYLARKGLFENFEGFDSLLLLISQKVCKLDLYKEAENKKLNEYEA